MPRINWMGKVNILGCNLIQLGLFARTWHHDAWIEMSGGSMKGFIVKATAPLDFHIFTHSFQALNGWVRGENKNYKTKIRTGKKASLRFSAMKLAKANWFQGHQTTPRLMEGNQVSPVLTHEARARAALPRLCEGSNIISDQRRLHLQSHWMCFKSGIL